MKEKERRKIKSEEKEMRRRERSNGSTLSFYNGYFGRKKKKRKKRNCWMQKVHLVVKISKIQVAIYFLYRSIITVIYILFYFFKTVERNF